MSDLVGLGPSSSHGPFELAVVVPCHNVADTLAEQLDALIAERWDHPWTIVVVDNNSTDDTAAIASLYADRGVRLVVASDRSGVAYVRNAGAKAVDARCVAFCDGDDVIHAGWVGAIGDALEGAELVGGSTDATTLNPSWLADSRPSGKPGALPCFGPIPFAPGGNGGMTRELFDRLGGYDEEFVGLEDIEFSLRARAIGVEARPATGAVLAYRYRDDLGSVWRQGFFYGRGRPSLFRIARDLGLPTPNRWSGLRSWGWLIVHLPELRNRRGRFRWTWVLANRLGVVRGAISERLLFV